MGYRIISLFVFLFSSFSFATYQGDPIKAAHGGLGSAVSPGTSGNVLTSNGSAWTSAAASSASVTSGLKVIDPSALANSSNTLPTGVAYSNIITIGTTAYLIGGATNATTSAGSAKVWSANLASAPDTFTDTTHVLPAVRYGGCLFRVDSNLYYVAGMTTGNTATKTIYTATTSAPTVWTDTGFTLPTSQERGFATCAIIGSKAYIFGGYQKSSIVSANTSDMTTWSTEGNSLPAQRGMAAFLIAGDVAYIIGGEDNGGSNTNTIWSANLSAPTTWVDSGATFPASIDFPSVLISQDSMYIYGYSTAAFGAGTTTISTAKINAPLSWSSYATSLPTASEGPITYVYDGIIYIAGGFANGSTSTSGLTAIQKSSKYITVNQPVYTGVSSSLGSPSFDLGGQPWILSTFNKLGYAPWWYNVTKPF